jgi:hypothetical protein
MDLIAFLLLGQGSRELPHFQNTQEYHVPILDAPALAHASFFDHLKHNTSFESQQSASIYFNVSFLLL